ERWAELDLYIIRLAAQGRRRLHQQVLAKTVQVEIKFAQDAQRNALAFLEDRHEQIALVDFVVAVLQREVVGDAEYNFGARRGRHAGPQPLARAFAGVAAYRVDDVFRGEPLRLYCGARQTAMNFQQPD